jgi:hypothetical protein
MHPLARKVHTSSSPQHVAVSMPHANGYPTTPPEVRDVLGG